MPEEMDSEEKSPEESQRETGSSGSAQKSEKVRSKRYELYEEGDDKVKRLKKACPRCGPGVFMADHGSRLTCGKCGYTEFKE